MQRLRRFFVGAQIALAVVLLTGAGLMLRSLVRLLDVNVGFKPTGVMAAELRLPAKRYPTDSAQTQFVDRLIIQVSALPGVESVAAVTELPLGGRENNGSFSIEGISVLEESARPSSERRQVRLARSISA